MSMAGGWRSNAYRAPRFSKNPGWRGAFAPLFEASFGIRKLPRSLALGLCLGAGRLIALTAEFPPATPAITICRDLVKFANDSGGRDNITAAMFVADDRLRG